MTFKNARNYQRFLRMAIMGGPKSGKSYTALTIAHALAGPGRVAVIDTENASASKYAELFPPFDVSELELFNPDNYVREIQEAERLGYDVLIIDSLTHAWNGPGGLLEYKDQVAKTGKGMNSYTAWSEATPKHTKLIYAITHAKMHVIVTLRTKVEYVLELNDKGKQVPVKVGLAPIQKDDTEYEFDIAAMMDKHHTMTIDGSRCPGLDNVSIPLPDGKVAETIKLWLAGEPMPEPTPQQKAMRELLQEFYNLSPLTYARIPNWETMALKKALNITNEAIPEDYTDEQVEAMRAYVASKKAPKQQSA